MRKTEEFKVLGIITLTLVLLLAFCLSTSDVLALLLLAIIAWGLGVFAYLTTYLYGIRNT